MSKLSKNILKKIKKKEVVPKPRWHFVLKNMAIWTGGLLLMILGIHATMLIFYFAMNLEVLDLVLEIPAILPKMILIGLPTFWIVSMMGLAFFAGYSMQKTKRGYKYSFANILTLVILIQLGVGGVLAQTPFAENLEKKLQEGIGTESLKQKKLRLWDMPEHGLISGRLIEMDSDQWEIETRKRDQWTIILSEETAVPPEEDFTPGAHVRLKGEVLDETEKMFQAHEVFPIRGRHREFEKRLRKEFQHLPPEERAKVKERIRRDGPPHLRKFLEPIPEEEREAILEQMKGKTPEERRQFFRELRDQYGLPERRKKLRDEHRWQPKNIEKRERIEDN